MFTCYKFVQVTALTLLFSPKEKFICRVCGKMLSTKGNLDVHEKIHVDLDPSDYIKCTVCGKPFKSRRFMLEHRKLVHDKSKMFSCPSCQHVSTCKGAFNIHFKSVHLKLKDFHCPDCGMGFCSNSQLVSLKLNFQLFIVV